MPEQVVPTSWRRDQPAVSEEIGQHRLEGVAAAGGDEAVDVAAVDLAAEARRAHQRQGTHPRRVALATISDTAPPIEWQGPGGRHPHPPPP